MDLLTGPEEKYGKAIGRALPRKIDGLVVRIASCEDLILLKLAAGRAIDIADVKDLYDINRDAIDREYPRATAARLGLGREVEEILAG